jgi:arylformamidase
VPDPIDISVRLREGMPIWPGSDGFRIRQALAIANGDVANVSTVEMDVHCGTHVESPLHFIADGSALDGYSLGTFVGPAHVLHLPDAASIGPRELEALPSGTTRLLLRTRNSDAWASRTAFDDDYVALTPEAAAWIAARRLQLVGIDSLSIQHWQDDGETHRILMRAGVAILEGLDLSAVAGGDYRLTCLPLRLDGAEASPVRAILEALP